MHQTRSHDQSDHRVRPRFLPPIDDGGGGGGGAPIARGSTSDNRRAKSAVVSMGGNGDSRYESPEVVDIFDEGIESGFIRSLAAVALITLIRCVYLYGRVRKSSAKIGRIGHGTEYK